MNAKFSEYWETAEHFLDALFNSTDPAVPYRTITTLSARLCPRRAQVLRRIETHIRALAKRDMQEIEEIANKYRSIELSKVYAIAADLTANSNARSPEYNDCSAMRGEALAVLESICRLSKRYEAFAEKVKKVFLPLDRPVYFMDNKISFFAKVYKKIMHETLRKNKKGISNCLGLALLHVDDGCTPELFERNYKHIGGDRKQAGHRHHKELGKGKINDGMHDRKSMHLNTPFSKRDGEISGNGGVESASEEYGALSNPPILSHIASNSLCDEHDASFANSTVPIFLSLLSAFGLKYSFLRRIKNYLTDQDLCTIGRRASDFKFVAEYFAKQKSIYPAKFYGTIEQSVLHRLYVAFGENELCICLKKMKDPGEFKYIYENYARAGLTDTLLAAYKAFIDVPPGEEYVHELHGTYCMDRRIMGLIGAKEFSRVSMAMYRHISEDVRAVERIAEWVAKAMENGNRADKFAGGGNGSKGDARNEPCQESTLDELYSMLAFIINCSKHPEHILEELRAGLGNRLLAGTTDSGRELSFLRHMKRMHAEKMVCMVEDAERTEEGLLLMKTCKWPVYATEDVPVSEVDDAKRRIAGQLQEEGKKVAWVDALAKAKVEVFGVPVLMTLFQYATIRDIAEKGRMPRTELRVPGCFRPQLDLLFASQLLIESRGLVALNRGFVREMALIPRAYVLAQRTKQGEAAETVESKKAFIEAKVARIMKERKSMLPAELKGLLPDVEDMNGYLKDLEEKGLVSFVDGKIVYVS